MLCCGRRSVPVVQAQYTMNASPNWGDGYAVSFKQLAKQVDAFRRSVLEHPRQSPKHLTTQQDALIKVIIRRASSTKSGYLFGNEDKLITAIKVCCRHRSSSTLIHAFLESLREQSQRFRTQTPSLRKIAATILDNRGVPKQNATPLAATYSLDDLNYYTTALEQGHLGEDEVQDFNAQLRAAARARPQAPHPDPHLLTLGNRIWRATQPGAVSQAFAPALNESISMIRQPLGEVSHAQITTPGSGRAYPSAFRTQDHYGPLGVPLAHSTPDGPTHYYPPGDDHSAAFPSHLSMGASPQVSSLYGSSHPSAGHSPRPPMGTPLNSMHLSGQYGWSDPRYTEPLAL